MISYSEWNLNVLAIGTVSIIDRFVADDSLPPATILVECI